MCSGAGKALAAMMAGDTEGVHELVGEEFDPGRFAVAVVAAAVATASQ